MKSLEIKNFKCIEEEIINFNKLTILAGENGAGKSTVMQLLAILKQSYDIQANSLKNTEHLYLNDYYTELGSFDEVLYCEAEDDLISLKVTDFNDESLGFICGRVENDENILDIVVKQSEKIDLNEENTFLDKLLKDFEFISADRFGPKTYHHVDGNFTTHKVGKLGEYTAVLLAKYKDDAVFMDNLNEELGKMFGFIRIKAEHITGVNISIMEITNLKTKSLGFKSPVNMPYGVSYVLPIIVSCLIRSNTHNYNKKTLATQKIIRKIIERPFVVIENPEAHLHPRAQSELGKFLGKMANEGVQIVIETHSDHIINGIRKAVKEKIISCDNVLFNFFERGNDLGSNIIKEIRIKEDGKLSAWPKGFFDQYDKDLRDINR